MLKKESIPIETINRVKCGDCEHFKRTAKFEVVCSKSGVKPHAAAPSCFSPDVWRLNTVDSRAINQLGALLNQVKGSNLRVLIATMQQQNMLIKRYGLKFGQPVYFRFGGDYLSNYFRGYVTGGTSSGDPYVYVSSDLSKTQRKQPLIAQLSRESVFTNSEFLVQKAKLIESKRMIDPKPLFSPMPKVKKPDDYEPPSMDKAPIEWFNKIEKSKKKTTRTKFLQGINGSLTFKVSRR